MRALFITWDAPELSYLESLFLPIFRELAKHGINVDVLQFRWGSDEATEQVRAACERAGSRYRSVAIWRKFGGPGALATALGGALAVRASIREFGSELVMPRSLMPAIAVLAAGASSLGPIVFDADGLAADERVEFDGLSPRSLTYRLLREAEARMIRRSDSVLVRSNKAREILLERAGADVSAKRFHIVTNGRDDRIFTPSDTAARRAAREEMGIDPGAPLIVYAGSVGKQYRFEAIGALAAAIRDLCRETRLLVLSGSPAAARDAIAATHPEVAEQTIFKQVPPDSVPRYLAAADLGVAYRHTSFSTQAVAPIKLSEYLLCGLPVVGTAAIGDTQAAVDAGVFLDEVGGPNRAAQWFVHAVLPYREEMRERARAVGLTEFSLRRSVAGYLSAFAAAAC